MHAMSGVRHRVGFGHNRPSTTSNHQVVVARMNANIVPDNLISRCQGCQWKERDTDSAGDKWVIIESELRDSVPLL